MGGQVHLPHWEGARCGSEVRAAHADVFRWQADSFDLHPSPVFFRAIFNLSIYFILYIVYTLSAELGTAQPQLVPVLSGT